MTSSISKSGIAALATTSPIRTTTWPRCGATTDASTSTRMGGRFEIESCLKPSRRNRSAAPSPSKQRSDRGEHFFEALSELPDPAQ